MSKAVPNPSALSVQGTGLQAAQALTPKRLLCMGFAGIWPEALRSTGMWVSETHPSLIYCSTVQFQTLPIQGHELLNRSGLADWYGLQHISVQALGAKRSL